MAEQENVETLERGNIYFLYRPRVEEEDPDAGEGGFRLLVHHHAVPEQPTDPDHPAALVDLALDRAERGGEPGGDVGEREDPDLDHVRDDVGGSALSRLDAAVVFYGRNPDLDWVSQIQAPMLLHYAGLDERINAGIADYEAATHELQYDPDEETGWSWEP